MFHDHDITPADLPAVPGLEVLDVVARGGHGTVYRARQLEHDRLVALKVLDGRFVDDDLRRRFDRERLALGRLSDHPAIVALLDSGFTEAGAPYLLLEYAPGGTLRTHLDRFGAMSLDEATALAVSLAAATERTHNAGVVHRDIKPGNILRSAYDGWMLTDFGIASLLDRSATTVVQVSYAHTAPETFDGGPPSATADVYGLASVLATCLTAVEPFEMLPDEAPVSAMRRVITEPYPDLRRAGVPDDLAGLLEMALSKEPLQRPVSARAFAAALNDIRVAHGLMPVAVRTGDDAAGGATVGVDPADLAAVRPSWSHPDDATAAPTTERRRGPRALVALALLVLAGFGVATLGSGVPDGVSAPLELAAAVVQQAPDDGPGGPGGGDGPDAEPPTANATPAAAGQAAADGDPAPPAATVNAQAANANANGDGNGNGNGPGNGPAADGGGGGNGPGDGDGDGGGNGPGGNGRGGANGGGGNGGGRGNGGGN